MSLRVDSGLWEDFNNLGPVGLGFGDCVGLGKAALQAVWGGSVALPEKQKGAACAEQFDIRKKRVRIAKFTGSLGSLVPPLNFEACKAKP